MAIFSSDIVTSAISASIADTAVDIFVYDTSKDSDGGAWRKRTTHTSWYNETLNTATRGSRKEFPSVAVIVAQENPDQQVIIYDGDDPDLPMWMVFDRGGNNDPFLDGSTPGSSFLGNYAPTSVSALNGIICAGLIRSSGALTNLNAGLRKFSFIEDACYATNDTNTYKLGTSFVDRNALTLTQIPQGGSIVNVNINGIVMTVLPNALIDDATGLPIPTIAVATDGGVSVIKDDGNIVNATGSTIYAYSKAITITEENYLWWLGDNFGGTDYLRDSWAVSLDNLPSSDFTWNNSNDTMSAGNYYTVTTGNEAGNIKIGSVNTWAWNHQERNALGGPAGLAIHKPNIGSETNSLIVAITSDYNTGYMPGDIQLATLSDTDATNLVGGTVADRSIKNTSVNVTGTITRTAVRGGADLVGYSGFSASNYLQQPYNSGLAPGTGAYSVTCWFKTGSSSSDQYIFDRNGGGAGSRNLLLIMNTSAGNANKFQWWHRDASGNVTDIQISDKIITDNVWHQVVALNDGSTYKVYVDGEVSSVTSSQIRNVVSDNNPPLFVGIRHSGGSTFITGSMALFRYSKSAPSPEQIKKMYEDEKCLFHGNAKATLYGSSDAVTALAYDDTTELLHVGTSDGRSDFQGLRQINNTTDPVTTAISAHDSLIIEQ
nr:hypothetical protein [uncultured Mediterranean phage uvMED]